MTTCQLQLALSATVKSDSMAGAAILRLIGPKRRIRKIDILIYACCGQYRYEKQCEKPPGI